MGDFARTTSQNHTLGRDRLEEEGGIEDVRGFIIYSHKCPGPVKYSVGYSNRPRLLIRGEVCFARQAPTRGSITSTAGYGKDVSCIPLPTNPGFFLTNRAEAVTVVGRCLTLARLDLDLWICCGLFQ